MAASMAGTGRPAERCGVTARAKASDCRRARASTTSRSREMPRDQTDRRARMTITTKPVVLIFPAMPKSAREPFTSAPFQPVQAAIIRAAGGGRRRPRKVRVGALPLLIRRVERCSGSRYARARPRASMRAVLDEEGELAQRVRLAAQWGQALDGEAEQLVGQR